MQVRLVDLNFDLAEASAEPAIDTIYEDIFTPEDQIPEFRPDIRG